MLINHVALECHFMQQDHFAPVTLERLFLQMNGIKVARDTASIMKHRLTLFVQVFIASRGADVLLVLGSDISGSRRPIVKKERTILETGYTTVSA